MAKDKSEIIQEILNYLNAIRSRKFAFSFRIVNSFLKSEDMPTGRGYDELIAKYKESSLESHEELERFLLNIKKLHMNSVLYSRRSVSFYQLEAEHIKKIVDNIQLLLTEKSSFKKTFPLPLSTSELIKTSYNGVFFKVQTKDHKIRLIGCAKRSYSEREAIALSDYDQDVQSALGGYDELVGVRHSLAQAFDYLEINTKLNLISVHVDICCPLTTDDLVKIRTFYTTLINQTFEDLLDIENLIVEPVNLFPYVQKFYDQEDGKVSRLGHATGTDSIKDERMRGNKKDLRLEPFHKKGLEEIETTESYSIKKLWPIPDASNTPSIELPGHFSIAGTEDATINFAILDQCANSSQYDMLLSKLA